jgi:hypothetical protein
MYAYEQFVERLVSDVRKSLSRQILVEGSVDDGAFILPAFGTSSACHASNGSYLSSACWALLADGSDLRGDDDLFERILRSIAFQRRRQRSTGLVDLPTVNLHSPPDTGFTILQFAPIVKLARRLAAQGDEQAESIATELGVYVLSAASGMVGRGFHTPNHRWVVCSALGQAMELFPEIDALEYIESILAETIDMNEDGEYSERSNAGYNSLCNQCLIGIADTLDKPEMLDLVRRNLDMTLHVLHHDGSIYSSVSRRQDRGSVVVPGGAASVFYEMARRDGNGVYASVADMIAPTALEQHGATGGVALFMTTPEYRTDDLVRQPIPSEYNVHMPSAQIWRVRRGLLSATAAAGISSPFELRYGDVHMKGLKVHANWFNIGQFKPETFERTTEGVRMTHTTLEHGRPGYDMPLGREVPYDGWSDTWLIRDFWMHEPFVMTMDVREVEGGFDVTFSAEGGMDRVMFDIECYFGSPGVWETDELLMNANSEAVILKSGYGVYRNGDHGISVGPGLAQHENWAMRGWDGTGPAFRVRMTPLSPVNHTVELRYGIWSVGEKRLIPE